MRLTTTTTRVLVQRFLGRPAMVAAVVIAPADKDAKADIREPAPIVVTVKFIDEDVLADIAARVQLQNLHLTDIAAAASEYAFELKDAAERAVMRLAWTPKRPGAEIVTSVIPFIAVAFAGFALLAALIYGYMRRTAATIAQGEQRLRYLALHDPLCGLPNRNYFGERLEQVIKEVRAGGAPAAVFYIDLDHFKDVNDTLGHPVGDELIRNVTTRLSGLVRAEDLVGRLGGDEFAVISACAADIADVAAHGRSHHLSDLRALHDRRPQYPDRRQHRNCHHRRTLERRRGRRDALRRHGALSRQERGPQSRLHLRRGDGRRSVAAQVAGDAICATRLPRTACASPTSRSSMPAATRSSASRRCARWTHAERGDIEPAQFIPIAEHSGLIIELGEWVLRRACTDGKAWPGLIVSVNVSPLQFRRPDFVDSVERILAETEFDPARLELEITESTLLGNVDSAEVAMHRLKAIGLRLALDDFGTGYSSLAYLRRFPFDKLKIDRSFVRSIERSPDAAAIVHAIVGLGRGLGMKVTAEGVETAEQQLFLRAAGVHSMQGYRFGRPGSPSLIATRLAMPWPHRSIARDAAALAG